MKTVQQKTVPQFAITKVKSDLPAIKITRSSDAYEFAMRFYGDDIDVFESFFILTLNRRNVVSGYAKISQGGVSGTVVDSRLIGFYALENLASGVILVHNHPSGENNPSDQDRALTRKLTEALALFDIKVLDHIIVSSSGYLSFSDDGLI